AALSGRRARHRYGHNTCSSAKGWPCKSTNVLPCIITSAWGNQEPAAPGQRAGHLGPLAAGTLANCRGRGRSGRVCARAMKPDWKWKQGREQEWSDPEGEHRTIVRMTRVASSRGRDRRAAAARKSGARPRRRGGAHGGCERAASAPVRESAGGPVGRAGRRSEEHEEREGRARRNRRGRRGT
ncbi:unnamed protein product, partial [Prorocentrum cordatum]